VEKLPAFESLFRDALAAVDSGDATRLKKMLDAHPELATERLRSPGGWLRDQIGNALDTFFKDPFLLWFVSEDAVRNKTLPPNIATIASMIIDKAKEHNARELHTQLDYALRLVAWSGVAREAGVQNDLLNVFINAGASTQGVSNDALVNGNFGAAEYLVSRGAKLTLPTALCLGKWSEADALASMANEDQKKFSLVLAALNGKAEAVRRTITYGVDINKPSKDLYSHATPLHHAVWSGSLDTVKVLVEAGARLDIKDSIHEGTPLGWAEYAEREDIVNYLKKRTKTT